MAATRTLLTAAALAAAVVAPSAAHAAEGFTAITSGGNVVHFHSDTAPGFSSRPVEITGLASGERITGLDRARSSELLALTTAGNIDILDDRTGKATRKFTSPVTGPVDPNAPLTFAVVPGGASARIVTPGRDVTVNLATGAATPGPGLTFAPGDAHAGAQAAPALDYGPDGRLIGLAGAQGAYVAQTAPGATTLQTLTPMPAGSRNGFTSREPVRTTVTSDGAVFTVGRLGAHQQSRFVYDEPATGKIISRGAFFSVKLAAVTADGHVADDDRAPKATITGGTLHRHLKGKQAYYTGLRVKVNEPGQTVVSIIILGHEYVGYIGTLDVAGTQRPEIASPGRDDAALRRAAAAGRRAIVHIAVHDWAGNKRSYNRSVHLTI
jgi:hypothetical protein